MFMIISSQIFFNGLPENRKIPQYTATYRNTCGMLQYGLYCGLLRYVAVFRQTHFSVRFVSVFVNLYWSSSCWHKPDLTKSATPPTVEVLQFIVVRIALAASLLLAVRIRLANSRGSRHFVSERISVLPTGFCP
jgi:hypothetical protein